MADVVTGETDSNVTETDKVEGTSATTDVKDTSAESSPAEPKGESPDLLTAVKAALKPAPEKAPDSENQGSEPDKAVLDEKSEKEGESDDLTEEELARLKPKTRKRIENLTAARRERDGRIAELEPKAKQFETMQRFIETANLSIPEVNDGFEVMRLLKNRPDQAYQRLKPIMDQLEAIVGVKLPDDLQADVVEGRITEARARELAQTRSRAAISDKEVQDRNVRDEQSKQAQAHQERQTQVGSTIAGWEKSKASSDPDWKQKQSRVMEIVQFETLKREKTDPSFAWPPDEALKFADEAYKRVNDEFKRFAPKPKAINALTDVASTRSEAKPTTALEAAKRALATTG